jgi:hypothetical protein
VESLESSQSPLRVGVLLDGLQVDDWVATAIEEILKERTLEISVVIVRGERKTSSGRVKKFKSLAKHFLYHAYQRIDAKIFGGSKSPFRVRDLSLLLGSVPIRSM